ncbi:MAG: tetratricopeptide repeat-containing sensor histidine kinase [Bacteroidia bacterium]
MRGFLFLYYFLLFCLASPAQNIKIIDSLNKTINSKAHDSTRIKALCDLSKEYSGTDNDKALQLATRAKTLSEATGNKKQLAYSLLRIGSVYDYKSVWDTALTNYLSSLKIFEELKDKSGMAACFQNIGVMYYYQLNFDKALEYYNKALDLRLATVEMNYAAKLYNNIGSVYRRQKKYNDALGAYRKSLSIKEQQKDERGISACFTNIAAVYRYTQNFDSALLYINMSLKIDSTIGSDHDRLSNFLTRGDLYLTMNKIPEAKADLLLCVELGKKINEPELLYNAYADLMVVDTVLKDYKTALNDQFLFIQYKDEVINKEKATQIEKLQALYESEKKDSEIKMLNLDSANKEKYQNTLYIIIGLIGVLFLVSLIFYVRKRRDNKLLTKQKQEIIDKTELLKEQAAQIARLQGQMNPHFMFNALNSIQQFIVGKNMSQSLNYLNDFSRLMRITLSNSEKEMVPLADELAFLKLYIRFEELRFENKFDFEIKVEEGLDTENVLIAPMLIQPFIENAVKHGLLPKKEKGSLRVSFSRKEMEKKYLQITISDNGIGRFASEELKKQNPPLHQSRGIDITKERIIALNIKYGFENTNAVEITDARNEHGGAMGTIITLTLPYLENF